VKRIIATGLFAALLINHACTVFAQDESSFVRQALVTKKEAIILSVIYPGLGQMVAEHKYKGLSLFVAETVSLIFAVNAHENYSTKQKVYNKDLNIFKDLPKKGSGQYADALAMYKDLKDKNDELNNLNTIRNTALIAAIVVYAYNVVDSIFFSSSTVESPKADIENKSVIVRSAMIDRTPGILLSKSF
jgi:hypothetical protein